MALSPIYSGIKSQIVAEVTAETSGSVDAINEAKDAALLEIGEQVDIATEKAAEAADAVGAVYQTAEALANNADGIEEGGYYGAIGIPVETEYTRFYARVLTGTGSASVTVLEDGYPVYGPVTVDSTATDDVIAVTMAAGSEVSFFIDDITDTVNALYAKIEGLPA